MLVDTHCHLDFPEFAQDRKEVILRARDQGIGYIVNIGSSLDGSRRSIELAREYDFIYAAVGVHPHQADGFDNKARQTLESLAKSNKVVAIGETGLDYYRNFSSVDNQKALLRYSLGLARRLNLPLVLHNRQAQGDILMILKEELPLKAVVHCFSADEGFLRDCLALGLFISFTCNITYKKAQELRNIVRVTPLDRLLLETDAPFLSPEGLRGRRNEPAFVRALAEEVARIKEVDAQEICRITTENARSFFHLP